MGEGAYAAGLTKEGSAFTRAVPGQPGNGVPVYARQVVRYCSCLHEYFTDYTATSGLGPIPATFDAFEIDWLAACIRRTALSRTPLSVPAGAVRM